MVKYHPCSISKVLNNYCTRKKFYPILALNLRNHLDQPYCIYETDRDRAGRVQYYVQDGTSLITKEFEIVNLCKLT